MPNNKNILREKINEACPELLKLEFGCEVEMKKYKGDDMDMVNASIMYPVPVISVCDGVSGIERVQYIDNFGNVGTDGLKKILKGENEGMYMGTKSRIKKILGKPPTLEHLLRTISDKVPVVLRVPRVYMNAFLQLTRKVDDIKIPYDLTKPPLEQSEEVLEALLKIIK